MSSINNLDLSGELCIKSKSIRKIPNKDSLNNNLNKNYEGENNQIEIQKQKLDDEEIFIDFNSSDPSSSSLLLSSSDYFSSSSIFIISSTSNPAKNIQIPKENKKEIKKKFSSDNICSQAPVMIKFLGTLIT